MNILEILAAICEASSSLDEERKEELRKEFEEEQNNKYNRGTVVAALAKSGRFDSYDIRRVVGCITTPEQAEAAIGLIESGRYDGYDIRRIISNM